MMDAEPAPPTVDERNAQRLTIMWTDAPADAAIALRDQIRQRGEKCVIRDSCFYASNCVEPAARLVFFSCGQRDLIVKDYRSEGYVKRFGQIEVVDVPIDAMGAPTALPAPLAEFVQEQEADSAAIKMEEDQLDEQLMGMSDDDLRAYVRSMTGKRQRWNASKETMIQNLRVHLAGGQVEDVSDEDSRPPAAAATETTTPPASEGGGGDNSGNGIGAEGE